MSAALPVIVSTPAGACSFALKSPRSAGLENDQVSDLFERWWERDKAGFRRMFTDTLMMDGSRMEPALAAELRGQDPLPAGTFDIFQSFFTDRATAKRITLIVNTAAGIVVGCAEEDAAASIQPDCTGTPALHLFLVVMAGLNPRQVTHLATSRTPEPGKAGIWTGD